MGRDRRTFTPSLKRALAELGENIRLARLRRHFSAQQVALRSGISLPTLRGVERGAHQVSIGIYANVLLVLGLETNLAAVARDDVLGRKLQDHDLDTKQRAPKRNLKKVKDLA
jgi:transcriptional regulator with XRE-family HTH domain